MNITPVQLRAQYDLLIRRYLCAFGKAAAMFGLPWCDLAAIASRESNMGLSLAWDGTGDGGHGLGIMQIDDRAFPEFRRQNWRDPEVNVKQGAFVLRCNIDNAPHGSRFTARQVGIAAYNCGLGGVTQALSRGLDVDAWTTRHDYSADVIARSTVFESFTEEKT